MNGTPRNHPAARRFAWLYALALGAVALSLGSAAASAATFETVDIFAGSTSLPSEPGKWPEDVQLGGVSGMAINRTGAGGVEPGTLYAVGFNVIEGWGVARYAPDGEFEMAWNSSRRCGPQAEEPAHPTCPPHPVASPGGFDVEIDQSTGNVYVFNAFDSGGAIRVYDADATNLISQFGEREPSGSVTTSPGKIHVSPSVGNIAVNDDGEVYVADEDTQTDQYHRLMVFRPQAPDDYEHYVYAGQSADIATGFPPSRSPLAPVLDTDGNIYVAGDTHVQEYDPSQPSTPVCTFSLPTGGIVGMTVNPATGEVFYYSYKGRLIHQLATCNPEGNFVEIGTFPVAPQRGNVEAMAVNPTLQCGPANFEPGVCEEEREPGVLYAGAGENCPSVGNCPAAAQSQSSLGYILALSVNHEPEVISQSVTQVTSASATLNARIDSHGSADTHYHFQYITDAAYQANEPVERFAGASEAPLGGALLGSGPSPAAVAATISGLLAGTEYHYRAIATNSEGTATGDEQTFRTFQSGTEGLPDARAYELVSPPEKNGGEVLPASPNVASCGSECKPGLAATRFPVQVTAAGGSVAYQGSPFTLTEGASEFDEHISRRTASGWQTTSLSPPLAGDSGGGGFQSYALDSALAFGYVFARNQALVPEAPPGYVNIFAQATGDRLSLDPLLKTAPPHRTTGGSGEFKLVFAGTSADFSRVFFQANDALPTANTPAAVDGGSAKSNLYEWTGSELRLVNIQPNDTSTVPGATFGSGFQIAHAQPSANDFSHAISDDGSRVFWSSESGQVYVREGGEATTEIPDHTGKFLSAAADGSKVLLDDGKIHDLDAEATTDLTEGAGGFKGLVGQSDDLSSIYFVDSAVLTGAPNERGAVAQDTKDNLYVWQEGSTRFIATLLPGDNESDALHVWDPAPVRRTAEASHDGRWLAFGSKAELTGVDSVGACQYDPDEERYVGSVPCEEVFLYDSATGELLCPSCNPVGANPRGGSFLRTMMNATGSQEQPRYLSNAGRLYFDSRDALVGFDTNNGVEDVYQFEPQGIGSCEKTGGCVSLISSGRAGFDSNFLAMDPAGRNVFFTTRERLVAGDRDSAIDLYDAREEGGFPGEAEASPGECQGETCQPAPRVPATPTPSSSSFEGAGNVKEGGSRSRCPARKRKVVRRGKPRCVPKHTRAKHRKHEPGGAK